MTIAREQAPQYSHTLHPGQMSDKMDRYFSKSDRSEMLYFWKRWQKMEVIKGLGVMRKLSSVGIVHCSVAGKKVV